MLNSTRTFNPMEAWTTVGMAMAEASVQLATSTARAAMACMAAPSDKTTSSARTEPSFAPAIAPRAKSGSWYRAPYRTPFDPLFWLTPGHPVDHPGDWLALGLCAFAPGMMPSAAWQPAWPNPFGHFMQPMQSMLSARPMVLPAGSVPAISNVFDIGSAYAAYRTAGGHASAQITSPLTVPNASSIDPMEAMAEAWRWMFPFTPYFPRPSH